MMNNQKTSEWLTHVKEKTAAKKSGVFTANDRWGKPVIFEWTITDVRSPEFSARMKEICELVVEAFTPVEMQFLKKHPELHDEYCASFEPIFKSGSIVADWQLFKQGLKAADWALVEEKMHSVLREIQLMDYSNFGVENVHCFVLVKTEKTKKLLGYITFYIPANYPFGTINATGLATAPAGRNRGLSGILMSSIFKIIPDVTRICACTRVTNRGVRFGYTLLGFTRDPNPIPEPHMPINHKHWVYLEYKTTKSDILQKIVATCETVK